MKHGLSKTRLYSIYSGMKQRCYNPNNQHYSIYGGKGITICDEWNGSNGLQNFFEWSLSHGYNEDLTIDRIDSSKGYSPNNCQWITASENSSRVHSSSTEQELGKDCTIYTNNEQLVFRLKKLLLDTKNSQRDIAKKMGISPQAFQNLLNKKQLSFADLKRILDCMNCNLIVDFSLRSSLDNNNISNNESVGKANIGDTKPEESPNKQYKQLTDSELSQIDLKRLVKDVLYQIEIGEIYGEEVLPNLLEYARQQLTNKTEE